ncbi:MAG: MerR family transcriptional regulator [Streptosporangiaceae bacterium]
MYSISAVARMLDIPVATLRTWEDRYQQVVPVRNDSGHRIFTRYQVEQLKFVRAHMSEGVSAADAHRVLAEMTDSGSTLTIARAEPSPQLLILLAESDPYAAEFAEYFLKTEGFDVEVAIGEKAAKNVFAETSPIVVIVEVLISGGAGLELCRYFKQHPGVSVIAVSAVQASDTALDAGADAFLLKPLDPLQLVSAVRDLLRSSAFLAR